MLTEKELSNIGYALITASEAAEINWKTVARELLQHIREVELAEAEKIQARKKNNHRKRR